MHPSSALSQPAAERSPDAAAEHGSQPQFDWARLAAHLVLDFSKTREYLEQFGIDARTLAPLCRRAIGKEAYGRHVLYSSPDFEIMLATWVAGAECSPHDHGFSNGAVWLAEGEFIESHYALRACELKRQGKLRVLKPDSLLRVSDGDIHSMIATHGGVSLHFYSPPIHAMKVYDPIGRATLTVTDDCGAWVPENSNQIVSREPWSNP